MSLLSLDIETTYTVNRIYDNGGSLQTHEIRALDFWIRSYKKTICDDGITPFWNKVIAYAPLIGGTQQSMEVYIKETAKKIIWNNVTSSMFTTKGFKGNGTTSFGNTGIMGIDLSLNNNSISIYIEDTSVNTGARADLLYRNDSVSRACGINIVNTTYYAGAPVASGAGNITKTKGQFSVNRLSSTERVVYQNGSIFNTISGSTGGVDILYDMPFYVGAEYSSGLNGPQYFTSRQYSSFFFGLGFTANEELKRYKIEQQFQMYLNRSI